MDTTNWHVRECKFAPGLQFANLHPVQIVHMNTTKAVQSFEIRLFLPYHPISFSVSTFILAFLGYYLEQYKYPLSR